MRIDSFLARVAGLLVGALLLLAPRPAAAQITQDVFGRGRIQYKRFDWQIYGTANFNVFYYAGGQEAARNAAEYAEKELRRVSSLIGYYPYAKTTLLLYNSVSDLRQSNIGLDDAHYQTGGETALSKNRIELAFEGRQTQFRRELSFRLTKLLLQEMLYGGSLKDQLRSAYLLLLPPWFVDGAAAYVAEGWSSEMDDYIRSEVRRTPQRKLETILVRNPRLAGQSIWNYVAERYGYTSIQNVLNLTRITRDEEIGFASSLNVPGRQFMRDWHTWYYQQNDSPPTPYTDVAEERMLRTKNRRGLLYTEAVFSPDGTQLAYVVNDRGTYRVRVRNVATGKERQLLRGGYKSPDQQTDVRMPLLAWRTNAQLAVAEVRRGLIELRLKTLSGKRADEEGIVYRLKRAVGLGKGSAALAGFAQVLDMSYSADGKQLVFSAVRAGQSDVYLLRAGQRQPEQLTNDVYDDLHPVFLPEGNAVAFSSNRYATDSLGLDKGTFARVVDNYDLFRLTLDPTPGRARLKPLTQGIANETQPRVAGPGLLVYLSEESGTRALCQLDLATGARRPLTSFGEHIKTYDFSGAGHNLAFVYARQGTEFVALYPAFEGPADLTLSKTVRQQTLEDRAARAAAAQRPAPAPAVARAADSVQRRATTPPTATTPDTARRKAPAGVGINTDNYQFDAEPVRPKRRTRAAVGPTLPPIAASPIAGPVPYDVRFGTTDVVTSLYADPLLGTGLVGEVRMADMLENHRIRAGFFSLTDFRTNHAYAEYAYLAKRYDLRLNYQKSSYLLGFEGLGGLRMSRHEVSGSVVYPLTQSLSVRVSPTFVYTRRIPFDFAPRPVIRDTTTSFLGGTTEMVFDNSVQTGLNQMEGTRIRMGVLKLYGVGKAEETFGKFYFDARHYQKIHRQLVWANHFSFGSYFGPAPKQFILGGVDNWLFSNYAEGEFSRAFPVTPQDLFYQQFVLPLRGFSYSERRGPKHILLNSELRLPIVQYLAGHHPIGSGLLRNLQLIGFFDAGSAYSGGNPFTSNNDYNTKVVKSGPFTATVTNYRNPFLYGYGFGARSTILGFYAKLDFGWGVRDGERNYAGSYLSLGYDF